MIENKKKKKTVPPPPNKTAPGKRRDDLEIVEREKIRNLSLIESEGGEVIITSRLTTE